MTEEKDALAPYREEIDRIDSELLRLLNRRAEYALSIGDIKKRNHQPIHVPEREQKVLERMAAQNPGPLSTDSIRAIFQQVFEQMKILENGEKD